MPADKPRNLSLAVHGHLWKEQPKDAFSRVIPLQGGVSVGNRFDMELHGRSIMPRRLSVPFGKLCLGCGVWHVGDFSA